MMTDQKQQEAIAQACGGWHGDVPDYLNDLNAMRDAAMLLREQNPLQYIKYAAGITIIMATLNSAAEGKASISAHDATARQRAEAFLKAKGLWNPNDL